MTELEYREATLTASDTELREVSGIAVPWNTPTTIGERFTEQFERGAVQDSDSALLFYGHKEPIGRLVRAQDTDSGWEIAARISETPRGDEVLTLIKDGVLTKFSIGFVPVDQKRDDNGVVIRTAVKVKEVSVVPFPAYEGATITAVREEDAPLPENVREDESSEERDTDMTETVETGLAEVRDSIEDLERRLAMFNVTEEEVLPQFRSAGELLKAIAAGDDAAIRAYEGGSTADQGTSLQNGWVGDLTKLVDGATVLYGVFSKGNLPDEGNYIEYSVLSTNSVAVTGQSAEGEPLTGPGKLTFTTATAPVYTRGGYVTLTRQAIERSSIPVLNHSLRAQAIALGKDLENVVRVAFNTAVAGRSAAAVTVADGDVWSDWQGAVIDAAVAFKAEGLSLDALIVATDVFKRLGAISATDGRPLMVTNGDGSNTVGTLRAKTLTGELLNVPVILDSLAADGTANFVNVEAVRIYTKPAVRLADEDVTALTKDFSVYQYIAVAPEVPTGIVPVTITA